MPKTKATATISGLIDSDMDDEIQNKDVEIMPTPDSNQENVEPAKKGRGKPKAPLKKVRKTKPASRRLSAGTSVAKTKAITRKKTAEKHAPLQEQVNEDHHSDTEEVEDFQNAAKNHVDQLDGAVSGNESDELIQENKASTKRGRPAAKAKRPAKASVVEQSKATEKDGEFEYTPTTTRRSKARINPALIQKKSTAEKSQVSSEPLPSQRVIPETQPIPMELDEPEIPEDEMDEDAIPQSVYRRSNHARAASKQPQTLVAKKPAGSTLDMERGGNDSGTRKKLGEMTKKFETLELKYRNLREVGIKEADANFEKLKKQSEEGTKAANDLIASLKKDLSIQKALAQESRNLQQQLATASTSLATSLTKQTQLTTSLSEAQNENKALQAKLAAHRSASSTVESVHANRTPGSALKAGKGTARTILVGSAEAAQAAQVAQLKEDLYSDLTGLILRGVDRGEEADVYDCIQTGRNGTLHFKLSIANDAPTNHTSYEDTEFTYTPRLDNNRDRDLLDILPSYLVDEITFSRAHAGKFYGRVMDVLTVVRRTEEEVEEEEGEGE